jgi:hypothetical protein
MIFLKITIFIIFLWTTDNDMDLLMMWQWWRIIVMTCNRDDIINDNMLNECKKWSKSFIEFVNYGFSKKKKINK